VIHPVQISGAKYLQLVQQVKHSRVECGLQEEHVALTLFNTKLCELKRGREGEEASEFQRGWHDQEAQARGTGPHGGKGWGWSRHRDDEPR